jgi:hypothetical protein
MCYCFRHLGFVVFIRNALCSFVMAVMTDACLVPSQRSVQQRALVLDEVWSSVATLLAVLYYEAWIGR